MPSATMAGDPQFDNLMSPVNIANPFPLYAELRKEDPVHWNAHFGFWQLSRYQDVRAAFSDQARFSSALGVPVRAWAKSVPLASKDDFDVCMRFFFDHVQALDEPAHARQRAAISKAFTPRVVEGMRSSIEERVENLIGQMKQRGESDFVADFAYPLPSLVIFDLIGIPEEHHEHIRVSAASFARFLPSLYTGKFDEVSRIAANLRETEVRLLDLIARRRREPRGDMLSNLASSDLSDDEIVVLCNFLLFAGHETTANLLAGSVVHLLQDRQLWNALAAKPELLPNAVEEMLRFISPALSISRVLTEEVTLHGQTMKSGDRVQLLIGSANHDEAEFSDPERIVLDRPKAHSMAFGQGAHFCIGAALARIEAQVSLAALQRSLPNLQLATETVEYQPVFFLRSFRSVPVTTGETLVG